MTIRLEVKHVGGKGWCVVIAEGNKKKGTRRERKITEPVYTLAQAQAFCNNNKVTAFKHLL